MIESFIKFVSKEKLFIPHDRVLLAVSGGIDSVVMADLFQRAGFVFDIAHVNFHLRGEESDRDELFVRKLAENYMVQVFVRHFETARIARKNKVSVQVAARELRYSWFGELLEIYGYAKVAVAHHLDDQVETFLINLARGTGIAGLHGIMPGQGKIIRPLMFTGRKEIEAYAAANKLDYAEDSSNASVKYTRNRIRHKVIPQLEKINPAFRQSLTETISVIRDAEIIYQKAIEEKRKAIFDVRGDSISIIADELFNLKPLATWAYELLSPFGFNISNIHDIIGLKNAIPGKEVISATYRLVRDRDHLIIVPLTKAPDVKIYSITAADLHQGAKSPVHLSFEVLDKTPEKYDKPATTAYIDLEKLEFPLQIRKWRRGDYFYPLGMTQRKKLSDFFTDRKMSKIEKENQWLLCSGEMITWVIGHRIDDRFKIGTGTGKILKISFFS